MRRVVIVPLAFRNCNFWKVFNTCLDFKLVTDNSCETGASGPYIAFAPFAWIVRPSGLLFLNYSKDIQTSHASLCTSVSPVLCLLVLDAYFKTQFLKNHSLHSGEGRLETSHWKIQINLSSCLYRASMTIKKFIIQQMHKYIIRR